MGKGGLARAACAAEELLRIDSPEGINTTGLVCAVEENGGRCGTGVEVGGYVNGVVEIRRECDLGHDDAGGEQSKRQDLHILQDQMRSTLI